MPFLLWQYLKSSAARVPDRPAVVWQSQTLTYRELEGQSNRLASMLRSAGIRRGARVALYMPKSHLSIVAMQGILKTGAAYVPIDPGAPPRRAGYILGNCEVAAVVTTSSKAAELEEHLAGLDRVVVLLVDDGELARVLPNVTICRWRDIAGYPDEDLHEDVGVETDPAYLLYTSGSTGLPKGVILTHRNALTFTDWAADAFAVTAEDRLSNHAPLHFDLSVFDVYVALKTGACIVIVPDQVSPFPRELAKWIEQQQITVWYSVPSALTRLLLHGALERFRFSRVRTVLFAGEVFPVKYLRGVMDHFTTAEFANLYGPTETNVCTYYRVERPLDPAITDIPIGRACANTEVFALDEQGRRAQPGEEGELFVRGPSVMPGYWRLPEKSNQMLVRNPLQAAYGEIAYRTGDIVKQRPDGQYVFVGRRDHMVKSRGYRIELGEIEQVLYAHEQVNEAVVVPVPDPEIGARLRAIIALDKGQSLSAEQLHAHCRSRLPLYMIPETFAFTTDLPKTSTGKIDRQALLESVMAGGEEATAR